MEETSVNFFRRNREKKHLRMIVIAAGVFLIVILLLLQFQKNFGTQRPRALLQIGEVEILADIAETPAARAQGLSGKEKIGEDEGMLFVFPKAGRYGFWMKDMRFPIDIVWIGEDMRIVGITKNVSPETFPEVFRPPLPARYVLETKSGLADTRAIEIGESISLRDLLQ